ncbi:MAG: hypothetical protein IID35_03770 [Planctomycetes bacterium]|nr:hypothetical protein [Planctomycetota bacterium]
MKKISLVAIPFVIMATASGLTCIWWTYVNWGWFAAGVAPFFFPITVLVVPAVGAYNHGQTWLLWTYIPWVLVLISLALPKRYKDALSDW